MGFLGDVFGWFPGDVFGGFPGDPPRAISGRPDSYQPRRYWHIGFLLLCPYHPTVHALKRIKDPGEVIGGARLYVKARSTYPIVMNWGVQRGGETRE